MIMKGLTAAVLGALLCLALVGTSLVIGATEKTATDQAIPFPEIARMTKEQLRDLLGKQKIVLLDTRPEEQWRSSDQMLPGAVHENPFEVKSWAEKYSKDDTLILY
jgi:hypothetical protein